MEQKRKINEKLSLLGNQIGRGGFGSVFRGELVTDGKKRIVAVKQIKEGTKQQIDKETEQVVKAKSCPYAVPYLDRFQEKGVFYLVFQLYDGDLNQFRSRRDKPSIRNKFLSEKNINGQRYLRQDVLFSILSQICEGIRSLHLMNIQHRDIKPPNFLYRIVGSDIAVRVGDFGLAKDFERVSKVTKQLTQAGTFNYHSPEQLRYRKDKVIRYSAEKSDAWSLAVVIYEILFDESFLQEDMEEHQRIVEENDEDYDERMKKISGILQASLKRAHTNLRKLKAASIYSRQGTQTIERLLKLMLEIYEPQRQTPRKIHNSRQKDIREAYQYLLEFLPKNLHELNKCKEEEFQQKQERKNSLQERNPSPSSLVLNFKSDRITGEQFEEIIAAKMALL